MVADYECLKWIVKFFTRVAMSESVYAPLRSYLVNFPEG